MAEILETLSTFIARIDKVQDQMKKPIVLSTDVTMPTLKDGDIEKVPIPWRFDGVSMVYTVTVPPETHVRQHSHKEDIFRYVVRGSLTINDSIQVNEGMWFVTKANTSYKIDTKTGYQSILMYHQSDMCLSNQPGGKHLIEESTPIS
jgi:redox-sensitive bicupin YhaK (pirin superfamily)